MRTPRNLHYPDNLKVGAENPQYMNFQFFERISIRKSILSDNISLYMPETVSNPSTISWDSEKVGYAVNTISNAPSNINTNSMMGFAGSMTGMGEATAQKLAQHGLANAGAKGMGLLGSKITADQLMAVTTGQIPNPYLTYIFRGVDFRSFSFVFKFSPRTTEDCDTIHKIINLFTYHSLPNKTSKGGTFLGYPSEVQMEYCYKDKPNPYLPKFKRCQITAVDHDFTPNGMFSVHRGAFPTQITMSLKFTETDINTREDYKDLT